MTRCVTRLPRLSRRALLGLSLAWLTPHADAQTVVARSFPATALRGTITFDAPPDVTLNKASARMSAGSRIRGTDNLLILPAATTGQTAVVNYTLTLEGLIHDVWILRSEEIANFWPRSATEAALYTFDFAAQTWTKP